MAKDEGRLRGGDLDARLAGAGNELTAHRMEALGRLATGISHDFKNLLTAILGNCHLMLEDQVVEARVGDILRETLEAAGAGEEIVSQLMRFSSPSMAVDLRADVVTTVKKLAELLTRFVGEDIRLRKTIGQGPLFVRLDTGQIEQIVMNLVLNAREAMPSGGDLELTVAPMRIAEVGSTGTRLRQDVMGRPIPPGDYVLVSVSDDGPGIPPDVRTQVFEPFFTTKEPGEGARGLGLSTVYGLVTAADGWIALRSEEGAGATINVYLPIVSEGQPGVGGDTLGFIP